MFDITLNQGTPVARRHTEAGTVVTIQPWLAHVLLDVLEATHPRLKLEAAADAATEPKKRHRNRRRKHTVADPSGIVELFENAPA